MYRIGSTLHLQKFCGPRDAGNRYNKRALAPGEDPDLLLNELELLSSKLEEIDPKCKKDELTLRVHVVNRLTLEYEPVYQRYSNELETTPMVNILRDL
jgi:hypothetical protein